MAKKKFYAVKEGFEPGIYEDWASCRIQVEGFKGAVFRGFKTRPEAESYLYNDLPGRIWEGAAS